MLPRLLLASLVFSVPLPAQPRAALFVHVDGIVRTLSEITGWPVRR
jgi:hypothetical protein